MKYMYSTSQMSKLSLTLRTFSIKITESGLCFFLSFSHFYFYFQFIFHFSIFRTLGLELEVISHI